MGAVYTDINTGIAGGSYNARTNKQANNLALESCNEKHKGKKIIANMYIHLLMAVFRFIGRQIKKLALGSMVCIRKMLGHVQPSLIERKVEILVWKY